MAFALSPLVVPVSLFLVYVMLDGGSVEAFGLRLALLLGSVSG